MKKIFDLGGPGSFSPVYVRVVDDQGEEGWGEARPNQSRAEIAGVGGTTLQIYAPALTGYEDLQRASNHAEIKGGLPMPAHAKAGRNTGPPIGGKRRGSPARGLGPFRNSSAFPSDQHQDRGGGGKGDKPKRDCGKMGWIRRESTLEAVKWWRGICFSGWSQRTPPQAQVAGRADESGGSAPAGRDPFAELGDPPPGPWREVWTGDVHPRSGGLRHDRGQAPKWFGEAVNRPGAN